MFGRPKFNRSVVKSFSPASPGGDGKALFVTDATNQGDGTSESVTVGKPGHTNYYVQCDVYFNYRPSYLNNTNGYERYGIFLRDDGFAGLDTTFEGAGNAYALMWDADDGRLRAGKQVDGTYTDFQPTVKYVTGSAWHTMRIEARGTQIKYFLDSQLLIAQTDSIFASGQCGVGYTMHFNGYPAGRGAYFDNFAADSLDVHPPVFNGLRVKPDGLHLLLSGGAGSTSAVERTIGLSPTNWSFFTSIVATNSPTEFLDDTNSPARFYRARRLP